MCISTGHFDSIFFLGITPLLNSFVLRNLTKMKVTTGFLSDCPSLMLRIAIPCIQHSQAMLERGVCELAQCFFHLLGNNSLNKTILCLENTIIRMVIVYGYFLSFPV